jgi:hypothetical protein
MFFQMEDPIHEAITILMLSSKPEGFFGFKLVLKYASTLIITSLNMTTFGVATLRIMTLSIKHSI